ncbi:MAG: hypothetical protein ACYTG4_14760 [Planctomycetota bacterium]
MKPAALWTLAAAALFSGCVYYNGIYNARHMYEDAERLRLSGSDSLAAARYDDVVRKAATGFRRDTEGPWAGEALYLIGRARLRMGELQAARAALEEAARLTQDDQVRLGALIYIGAALVAAGDDAGAMPFLNQGLEGLQEGPALAEGHLLRAGLLFEAGEMDAGWWDLDRAGALDAGFRTAAAMERVRWGVRSGSLNRTREGARRLLSYPEAAQRRDDIVTLFRAAAVRWGAEEVADLLGNSQYSWGRMERGDALLARAELLFDAGDTTGARVQAEGVAGGFGEVAAEARILLARWRLEATRDLGGIDDARRILLPSEEHPEVAAFLLALDETFALAELGLSEPLAWFAAGEVARDGLGAPVLARGLFLAYADGAPDDPWAAKALLAAMSVSREEGDRAWLRGRLEARSQSPYVLAARGESAPGFEVLEEELARRLQEMRNR